MRLSQLPGVIRREIPNARLPINYETAKAAMASLDTVDECKDWANRMAAAASYYKQSKDTYLYEVAIRVRARAVRRLGQHLAALTVPTQAERAAGAANQRKETANRVGISQPDAARAVRIASIHDVEFENRVEASPPPTLSQLDPGWNASLYNKVALPERLGNFTNLQAAISPLAKIALIDRVSAVQLAKEIEAIGIPKEHLEGLRVSVRCVSDWLDTFEQHLPKERK